MHSTVTHYLDAKTLFRLRPLAQSVRNTDSIWEAYKILRGKGVYTEMDIEMEAKRRKITSYRQLEEDYKER
ncbi:MAG: DUF1152 domain-containing protein [Candidatus Geothermarchaeales archaeon]